MVILSNNNFIAFSKSTFPPEKIIPKTENKDVSDQKVKPLEETGKKEIAPASGDKNKSSAKDTKKKAAEPKKDAKKEEVWDDVKKGEKIESTLENYALFQFMQEDDDILDKEAVKTYYASLKNVS